MQGKDEIHEHRLVLPEVARNPLRHDGEHPGYRTGQIDVRPAARGQYLRRLSHEATRTSRMIEDVLDPRQIEQGQEHVSTRSR